MSKATMSLMQANTTDKVCSLQRDNFEAGDYWLVSDGGHVTLAAQRQGEQPTARITIPRKLFNRLVRAYTRQQKKRKAK